MERMTLEQKMTLKAILEGDYNINRISYKALTKSNDVRVYIEGKDAVNITPTGKIVRLAEVEVEL